MSKNTHDFVRKSTLIAVAVTVGFVLQSDSALARVVGTESFDYADGAIAGQTGGTGFAFEQTDEGGAPASTASDWDGSASVSGGALPVSSTNAFREYNGLTEGSGAPSNEREGAFRGFGTTYYRFEFESSSTAGFAGLSTFDFGTEKTFFGQLSGGAGLFGISETGVSATSSSVAVTPGQKYTVVAEHDFDRNEVKLWVNPSLSGEASHDAVRTYTSGNWNSRLRVAAGSGTTGTFDDLVVSTTFAQAIDPNLNLIFADDLNKANGTTIPGSSPDVASGPWRQTAGGALSITDGAVDTSGGGRTLFGDFAQPLGAGETLFLDFETIDTAGAFHSGGFAGISLFTGSDGGADERLFIGDLGGGTTTWGLAGNGGFGGDTGVSGEAKFGQFYYEYDTGDYRFLLDGVEVLSGTATANLAFDRVRIANGSGGDIAVSNLLVATIPPAAPEPSTGILFILGVCLSMATRGGGRRRGRN